MEIISRKKALAVVTDFYRVILQRNPDPPGAKVYEQLIRRVGLARAIPKMLTAFLRSPEYNEHVIGSKRQTQVNTIFARYGQRLVDGRPIRHLTSLGANCLPSTLLKNSGLKSYSAPFDWLFSTPQMVLDCLADDFATFLDKDHYRSITDSRPSRQPGADHLLYSQRYGVRGIFAHRDPTREQDYRYLVRCVERFRRLLASDEPKLFLQMGLAGVREAYDQVIEALGRRTRNFVLVALHLRTPTNQPALGSLKVLQRRGEHALFDFAPSSYDTAGNYFPDKLDEWMVLRLLCQYQLSPHPTV